MSSRAIVSAFAASLALAGCATTDSSTAGSDQALNEDGAITFDLMHTVPLCNHAPHPDTWCTHEDQPTLAQASQMEARANAILDKATDPAKAKIVIAYFSFSNKTVYDKLCEKGRAGFDIEGFFDQSYRTQMPAQLAQSCQGPSGKNVRVHFLGQLSDSPYIWRLHHNKFLLVDSGEPDAPVNLNFSSGNLSSFGMAVHFDHWVVLTAPRSSNLVKQHQCVIGALRKAINPTGAETDQQIDDPDVYRSTLNDCLQGTLWHPGIQWVEDAIAHEKIAPIFSPDASEANAQLVVNLISRVKPGGKIYGAMQHFLHYGIAEALADASRRGVEIRLVMDAGVVTGTSEVQGVKDFYDAYLKESVTGMKIQFLYTNASEYQMMHNKFIVMEGFDGTKTRVFSGAGHFTDAGMRDNYENFYVTESDALSGKYRELFDYMWPRTLTEQRALEAAQQPNQ